MNVSFLQFDVQHDRQKNFDRIESYLPQCRDALVVLPELSLCGYLFEDQNALLRAAEEVPNGPSTQKMQALSKQYDCTLVFGLAEKTPAGIYNTAVVVSRGQYLGKYQKIHLSDFEKQFFLPGSANGVIETDGHTLGIQICFDLWFPEIAREQVRLGADILCVLANFGGETTRSIAVIRAIENLTPLVLCNRIGTEETPAMNADFLGKSCLLDAQGQNLHPNDSSEEAFARCTIPDHPIRKNVICGDFESEMARHEVRLVH